ncbi:MAG: potassium channel family protein [Akkermansiaceae bacterium]|nr:potassium channel family protein [Akkermansiaceae bacterium]
MPSSNSVPIKKGRYTSLLICLLVTMVGLPLLEHLAIGRILLSIWFLLTSVVFIAALTGSGRQHRMLLVASGIFCALLLGNLVVELAGWDSFGFQVVALPYGLIFLSWLTGLILSSIYKADKVTPDLISGAVIAYLLLGICWGGIYSLIELIQPGSFSFNHGGRDVSSLFYYSFVTLTTLGYGDILPLTKIARTTAYLEAVTGVMFTAILVAGLVGSIRMDRMPADD